VVEADRMRMAPSVPDLVKRMAEICGARQREYMLETLREAEQTRAACQMFRAWGLDPSGYMHPPARMMHP
jgi:hypothetical protein